ncbi:hypothetical protein ACP1EM_004885, partial [Escherichia coli]
SSVLYKSKQHPIKTCPHTQGATKAILYAPNIIQKSLTIRNILFVIHLNCLMETAQSRNMEHNISK